MIDKQIIIDVCPYQGECSVSGCKRNDDGCFVKQLFEERDRAENRIVELNKTIQTKEQECEELNKTITNLENIRDEFSTKLDQLKAENENLKQYKASKQASYESMQREWNRAVNANRELKAENEKLKNFHINLVGVKECEIRELARYKQAIEKMREIANRPYLLPCGGDCKQQNCTDKTTENGKHCMELKLIQILQICDEVTE